MKYKIVYGVVVLCVVTFSFPVFTDLTGDSGEGTYIRSNNAKLYEVLKLIDDRSQWLRCSELLREILASDIENSFVRHQLSRAKREIDSEVIAGLFRERILDWPFVVAKLRIMEAMMVNHPQLNISYDREVPLIKGLIRSYFFPGHEEEGEIIFPNPSTYKFDLYGYIKENVLKTDTAPSGDVEDPRFPLGTNSRNPVRRPIPDRPLTRPIPVSPPDRHGRIEPTPEDFERDMKLIKETLDRTSDLFGATFRDIQDLIKVMRRVDQYEPWSLLLMAISNPDAAQYDPQLKDFLKGVKLRLKVETYAYDPQEQLLLKEVLGDQSDVGLTLEEEIDSTTGQVTLYALANLTSPEVLSLRSLIYFKKFMDFYASSRETRVAQIVVQIAGALERWSKIEIPINGSRWATAGYAVAKYTGKFGNFLVGSQGIISKLIKWERFQRLLERVQKNRFVKNERYFKIAIALTMATDFAEGVVRIIGARDPYDTIDAIETTLSREAATFLYVLPLISQKAICRYAGWTALGLDFGHWMTPKIPRTSLLIESFAFDFLLDNVMDVTLGKTFNDMMIGSYEQKMGISSNESQAALTTFEQIVTSSASDAELIVADEVLGQQIKEYVNKRLFMIYYLRQRWDNLEVEEMGEMERRYWGEYQDYGKNLTQLRALYNQKKVEFSQKEGEEQKAREDLLRQLRERREERRAEEEDDSEDTEGLTPR